MKMCQDKYKFKVTWEPFVLLPDVGPKGVEKPTEEGPNTCKADDIVSTGKNLGIDFTYKANFFPHTVAAHCAMEYALQQDPSGKKQFELLESLFKSYHTAGEYPDVERVTSLAASVGLNKDDVKAYVNDSGNQEKIWKSTDHWSKKGVQELPVFVINGEMAFKGPDDPKGFLAVFEKAAKK